MKAKGTVHKFGDNVDTDVIIPARYLNKSDEAWLASHCMEDIDADFVNKVKPGDIMVAEANFGCGSSREQAPEIIKALKDEFEKDGIKVFPISAVSGQGLKELLYHVSQLLETCGREPVIYEQEYDPALRFFRDDPYTITMEDDETFVVEGPKIEKMLGYTNIESEKGFLFFQRFLKEQGILDDLEEHGIQEGDTVKMYGHAFEYYK